MGQEYVASGYWFLSHGQQLHPTRSHLPGVVATTVGCIGQLYAVGAITSMTTGTNFIPQSGHLSGVARGDIRVHGATVQRGGSGISTV